MRRRTGKMVRQTHTQTKTTQTTEKHHRHATAAIAGVSAFSIFLTGFPAFSPVAHVVGIFLKFRQRSQHIASAYCP